MSLLSFCAVTTSAFVAQALYDFLSFECNGEEWVAVLLVACETIKPSESVRVHYGKSFENLRKWVAAPKGKLLEKTSLGQFLSFLSARGLSLVDVLPMCVPADGVPYSRAPRVPAIRPPTKVDSAPPVLAACQSALAARVPPPTPQAALSSARERRMPMPIQRLNASHHIPSLSSLRVINHNFEGCLVEVRPVEGKGLGVVARASIPQGALFAYYLGRLLVDANWASRFCVASVSGEVMDLFNGSFPSPGDDGIPYVGPFANEPTGIDGVPNCEICEYPFPSYEGRRRRFGLVTLRKVKLGEELVWDYGPLYAARDYPSKYNS